MTASFNRQIAIITRFKYQTWTQGFLIGLALGIGIGFTITGVGLLLGVVG